MSLVKITMLLFSCFLSTGRGGRSSIMHKDTKRPCEVSVLGQSITRLPSGNSIAQGTCCPQALAPSEDFRDEQMHGFRVSMSQPAAAGWLGRWAATGFLQFLARQLFHASRKNMQTEGGERCMSWRNWSWCFPQLHQLPLCLCPYHQLQPSGGC